MNYENSKLVIGGKTILRIEEEHGYVEPMDLIGDVITTLDLFNIDTTVKHNSPVIALEELARQIRKQCTLIIESIDKGDIEVVRSDGSRVGLRLARLHSSTKCSTITDKPVRKAFEKILKGQQDIYKLLKGKDD